MLWIAASAMINMKCGRSTASADLCSKENGFSKRTHINEFYFGEF